jgi:cytochrome c oxidase subunit 3
MDQQTVIHQHPEGAPGHAVDNTAHGHHPMQKHHFDDMTQQYEASGFGMWVFLVQEVMFFGGLFVAYLVYRHKYFEAFGTASATLRIWLGTFNTIVLIASSLTMAMAVNAASIGKRKLTTFFLLATLVLGSTFLGVKVFEYAEKFEKREVPGANFCFHPAGGECSGVVERADESDTFDGTLRFVKRYLTGGWGKLDNEGEVASREHFGVNEPVKNTSTMVSEREETPQTEHSAGASGATSTADDPDRGPSERQRSMPGSEIYFGLYFAMTGMHALHMIIGAGILLWLIYWAWQGLYTHEYFTPVENFGLYWHFVDIIWIYLFPLLYLINRHIGSHH